MASIHNRAYEFFKRIGPLRRFVQGARGVWHRYRVPAWYVEGVSRTDAEPLSMVFAGHLESKNYFAHLMFAGECAERFLGTTWTWNAWRNGVRLGPDMIVTRELSGSRPSRGRDRGYCIPSWIGTETDVDRAGALCRKSGSIKRDVRRLTRSGLTYVVTTDPEAIASFYHTMCLPYARRAHGNRAMLTPWEEFSSELDCAELIQVQRNGETIAGNLLVDLGERRVRARALGVKNGDLEYVQLGAVVALYYFMVEHLLEKGCEKIHFGASRPFLKDGVLGFKKKYGARIVDRDRHVFRVNVARYSDGAKSFLRNNPFVSESDGCYYANFFVDRAADIDGKDFRSNVALLSIAGIAAARVYNLENARGPLDADGRAAEPTCVEFPADGERFVPAI